jgi:type IV pilus assembly protein PilY1
MNRYRLNAVLGAIAAIAAPFAVQAQSQITEDFTRSTTQNSWWFFNGACLTAGTATGVEPTVSGGVGSGGQIPGCTTIATSYYDKTTGEKLVGGWNGTFPDPAISPPAAGEGALRFTNGFPYGYSENGGVIFSTPFPTGQGVSIIFKTVTYLGNSGGTGLDGADGISFFLMDASKLNTATITGTGSGNGNGLGSWGGSLGYTCSNSNPPYNGLIGGYLGLGIDEYGNFLNGTTNTLGETGTVASGDNTASGGGYQPGRIGLRGAGNIAWATLNEAYGGTTNPGSGKPYYPNSLATTCHINGGTASGNPATCGGSGNNGNTSNDAMMAVQNTCATGTLWNYNSPTSPTSAGATSLTNGVNTGSSTNNGNQTVAPLPIAPILDYTAQSGGYVVLPAGTQIANETATTRPAATPIFYQLKISQNGLLSLSYSICPASGCGAFISVIKSANITTANGPLPANFLFGFAGSTGGSSNIHEILCFQAAPATSASSSAGASEKQSAKLETGTQAYFAYYNPSNGWTGRVTASSLEFDQYGNVTIAATPNWDASCVLTGVASGSTCSTTGTAGPITAEGPTSRTILSWNGTTGIPFEWNNLTTGASGQQAGLNAGDTSGTPALSSLTCPVADPVTGAAAGAAYAPQDRLDFLRGDRACEINSAGSGLFRRRTSVLADIIDSSPIWVGAPDASFSTVWSDRIIPTDPLPENASTAQTYPAYVTEYQARTQVVYVGANDGLLHGFRSGIFNSSGSCATNPVESCFTNNDGLELLAYMPGAIVQNAIAQGTNAFGPAPGVSTIHSSTNAQIDYANAQYGHNFWVDATPGTGDLFFGGAWHTWLVGGLGAGGAAIYALDVSNPANFAEGHASTLVVGEWNSSTITCSGTANCGNNLGNTYGTPQIRRLHDGNWAIIFGNGFGSTSGDAGIFVGVISPSASTPPVTPTFYYLSTKTGSAASPNGIAYATPVDLDGDHVTDYVYAGDLQGNIWRFDLTSATEATWVSTAPFLLFKTPAGQPITTSLVVASGAPATGMAQQLMVLFGSGEKIPLTNASAATFATATQSLYGVWDWNMSEWNSLSSTAQYASLAASATGLSSPYTLQACTTSSSCSNLQPQTVTIGVDNNRDINTNATICWAGQSGCTGTSAKFGWYLNFPGTQEQVIYSPELVSSALTVNTIVPAVNSPTSCTTSNDTGFTYVLNALTGGAFTEVFLPPSEAANPGVNTNQAYLDTHAIAMQTNATGSSFITSNSSGTQFLVYETNQVESGNGSNNIQGGSLGLNLPPNTSGRRLGWIELR